MNRIITLITFLLLATANLYSQDLVDTMIEVKKLIDSDRDDEAIPLFRELTDMVMMD